MDLIKTEFTPTLGQVKLDKVLINCENDEYYKLVELLYTSQTREAIILKALFNNNINVVLKFCFENSTDKEYIMGGHLLTLPNFIKFLCKFNCNDNIIRIINHQQDISNYKICHYGDDAVGILVMKYYELGSVYGFNWTTENFHIFKNMMKQVTFAILYAYDTKKFIHGDLHTGNVLLKPKKTDEIIYGDKILLIEDYEVRIMDFQNSKINHEERTDLFKNLEKFFSNCGSTLTNKDIFIDYKNGKIIKMDSITREDINYYDEIEKIIDNLQIIRTKK